MKLTWGVRLQPAGFAVSTPKKQVILGRARVELL